MSVRLPVSTMTAAPFLAANGVRRVTASVLSVPTVVSV